MSKIKEKIKEDLKKTVSLKVWQLLIVFLIVFGMGQSAGTEKIVEVEKKVEVPVEKIVEKTVEKPAEQTAQPAAAEQQAPQIKTEFGNGTFAVGTDIQPGTYKNEGGNTCYYERLKGFGGTLDDIIANSMVNSPTIVTIAATDKGFKSTGCGTWKKTE